MFARTWWQSGWSGSSSASSSLLHWGQRNCRLLEAAISCLTEAKYSSKRGAGHLGLYSRCTDRTTRKRFDVGSMKTWVELLEISSVWWKKHQKSKVALWNKKILWLKSVLLQLHFSLSLFFPVSFILLVTLAGFLSLRVCRLPLTSCQSGQTRLCFWCWRKACGKRANPFVN